MSTPPLAPAASVLLVRCDQEEPELFLVRRSPRLRFLGGFHAFPGGKVDPGDGPEPEQAARLAAVRELFEETGILLAVDSDGKQPLNEEQRTSWRRDLLSGQRTFTDLLQTHGLNVPADLLPELGHLFTPPFSPVRFDTAFFLAHLPEAQFAEVWPGELDSGEWLTARAAIDAWYRGEILLSPPTVALLRGLVDQPVTHLIEACRAEIHWTRTERAAQRLLPLWFSPGVNMIPLRTPALPPASFTNAFLVGTGPRYLIDPGATEPDEQALLFELLDKETVPLTAVILTHHHIDHVGTAQAVADRYRVPVWAHADAAALLADQVTIHRHLEDGCRLDLGDSPTGERWEMQGLLTPGHAPGHLVFYLPKYQLLLAGDMVSTLSSILVAPPDGNLRQYLASLHRLVPLPLRLLLPAHGGPSARPTTVLQDAIEHRMQREAHLLEVLASGARTLTELVPEIYRGVPQELWPLAELQLLGNLHKLREEGRVFTHGESEKGPWELQKGNHAEGQDRQEHLP